MIKSFSLLIVFLVYSSLLSGCSHGVAEFGVYSQAFDAQFAESEIILDSIARAERIVGLRRLSRGRKGLIQPFDPYVAAYYVDSVDPPLTASIRASLKSLKSYNEALAGLANGEAAAALSNRVGQISSNFISAAAAAQSAFASPAVVAVGADKWVGDASDAVNFALPIFQKIAGFAAQESFRQQLVAAYPAMQNMLATLRAGTPSMFLMLERSYAERQSETVSGLSAPNQILLEKNRAQLAGWTLLLDKTLEVMDAAAAAAMNDMSTLDLARLTDTSLELKLLVEKVKIQRNR